MSAENTKAKFAKRYSKEQVESTVREVLDQGKSIEEVSAKYGVNKSSVYSWIKTARDRRNRSSTIKSHYLPEFRQRTVDYVIENNLTVKEAVKKTGVNIKTLQKWVYSAGKRFKPSKRSLSSYKRKSNPTYPAKNPEPTYTSKSSPTSFIDGIRASRPAESLQYGTVREVAMAPMGMQELQQVVRRQAEAKEKDYGTIRDESLAKISFKPQGFTDIKMLTVFAMQKQMTEFVTHNFPESFMRATAMNRLNEAVEALRVSDKSN